MMMLPEEDPRRLVWAACQSPIEEYLCAALFAVLGCFAVPWQFDRSRLAQLAEIAEDRPRCFVFSQHPLGRYRSDFLLVVVDPSLRKARQIVVECDGAKFHEGEKRTAYDAARDAVFNRAGLRVVRFSGADLFENMRRVLNVLSGWIEDGGAKCHPPDELRGYAKLLMGVTPNREINEARRAQREKLLTAEMAEAAAVWVDPVECL